jgi:hypothetical protein
VDRIGDGVEAATILDVPCLDIPGEARQPGLDCLQAPAQTEFDAINALAQAAFYRVEVAFYCVYALAEVDFYRVYALAEDAFQIRLNRSERLDKLDAQSIEARIGRTHDRIVCQLPGAVNVSVRTHP